MSGDGDYYLVAERWEGDSGIVLEGPLGRDEVDDATEQRREEADDFALFTVTSGVLRLHSLTGHEIEVADGVGWTTDLES